MEESIPTCTAFAGHKKIAAGPVLEVAGKVKRYQDKHPDAQILIFDDSSSQQVELDLRGTVADVVGRISGSHDPDQEKSGPGRPKLGVVSREIGLLPRHWDWLALQPGGASVTLRKLVEEARKQNKSKDAMRQSQNAAYRFMSAMAGDLPHFEEASRAFFAKNKPLFETLTAAWPKDIRDHVLKVGELAFYDEKSITL
jgi:hypothetical protein